MFILILSVLIVWMVNRYGITARQKVKNDIDVAKGSGIYTVSVADSEYELDIANTARLS